MLSEFDRKAGDWDKNQVHHERSKAIAEAMLGLMPADSGMTALEFGAGTGLLSFLLKDHFSAITLMDNSQEMILKIREKITAQGASHMHPVMISLEDEEYSGTFDVIFSQMVFHHVKRVESVLQKLIGMLNAGGMLFIADLYPEDGSFHGDGFTGHKGFDPDWLAGKLDGAGLKQIRHHWCYTVKKQTGTGQIHEYPVFIMKAIKLL